MTDWRAEILNSAEERIPSFLRVSVVAGVIAAIVGSLVLFSRSAQATGTSSGEELLQLERIHHPLLTTAIPRLALQAHQAPITELTYSPDGSIVATGSQDGTVAIWDSGNGSLVLQLVGHSDGVNSVAFSPDGEFLISGSDDRSAILWNVSDGSIVRVLDPIMESRVVKVDFSPDGSLVAIGGNRCVIELRRVPSGILRRTIVPIGCAPGNPGGSVEFWGLAFSEDGRRVLTGDGRPCCGGGILQWYETGEYVPPDVLKTGNVVVRDLTLSGDESEIALALVGLSDIWILDAEDGVLKTVLPDHVFRVNDIEYSPDGSLLASVSNDTGVGLWNTMNGSLVRMVQGHLLQATALGFSPDGQNLATGSQDGELHIWSVDELLGTQ